LANWLFTWHCAHCVLAWAPVSGNPDVAWLKVELSQLLELWQREQSVGMPAAAWFGLVVAAYSFAWHP
jgi:hypothetical protein